jgi:DNA-binding NtrC family response regulator
MPLMTGVEVLRAARQLQPQAIRMLLTGYSDLNAIIGSINEGEIFRFISKPWSNDDLRATLAAAAQAARVQPIEVPGPVAAAASASLPGALSDIGVMVLAQDGAEGENLRQVLSGQCAVHMAADAEECVTLLEQHRIGVLITEMTIGGEPVTGLLAALRQHQPALVAIVLTGQADAGHAIELVNHGQIYRLLQKPAKEALVRGTVNMASRRFEALKANPEQAHRFAPRAAPPPPALEKSGLLTRIRKLLVH